MTAHMDIATDDGRRQITNLVPDSAALLRLAREGLERARAKPDDTFLILSTFNLLNSLRDWLENQAGVIVVPNFPYSQAVREIANGTKHLHLDSKSHRELYVEGMSPEGGWDHGSWDDLHFDLPMITVLVRASGEETPY